jgi:hypothetical protein
MKSASDQTINSSAVKKEDVLRALNRWGSGLVSIATAKAENKDVVAVAKDVLQKNYFYGSGTVLFKPTLASKVMFRTTFEGALSYFVGGNPQFPEDAGFALNPWVKVEFEPAGVITGQDHAIVMGNKLLTNKSNQVVIANFTMGFIRCSDGELRINLHHSSLPYVPPS